MEVLQMTTKDGEFLDLMNQFEKDIKKLIYGHKIE
jgi:hypothetical protein